MRGKFFPAKKPTPAQIRYGHLAIKEVHLGNMPPETRLHHTKAADKWLLEEELYVPRKVRDQRR